ncbi:DUF3572 domain-containing protein [Pararhodobacter oceanensis]|uniref:DUF3572 domain-containing protein n=1 Tax=Pararhodobacter oceanensis TaxID=2172121 RepID=A0A2T8HWC2_9RHOB|nr:DUF3572 domain-containing protein [Pararhodobacter oceanensis]PVH29735.1 DUF3572 domain-containing protein [Pararhodobacter oceanensis]
MSPISMSRAAAEEFAALVLSWLTEDHARIGGFLAWSGLAPEELRAGLAEGTLLPAVLDYLTLDEAMLLEACQDLDYPPETPMTARQSLPGGEIIHWT